MMSLGRETEGRRDTCFAKVEQAKEMDESRQDVPWAVYLNNGHLESQGVDADVLAQGQTPDSLSGKIRTLPMACHELRLD